MERSAVSYFIQNSYGFVDLLPLGDYRRAIWTDSGPGRCCLFLFLRTVCGVVVITATFALASIQPRRALLWASALCGSAA